MLNYINRKHDDEEADVRGGDVTGVTRNREKKPEEEFTHTAGRGFSGPQERHERLGIQ